MHVMLCYSIYPPIQAGGAELIVSYLAEGLVQRGHRVTVLSTCGPRMEPYADELRNGVEIIRFFPKNRYWLFERDGRGGLDKLRWHLTDAWNRDAGRRMRQIMSGRQPDLVHSHCVDGFSPILWHSAKQLGLPIVHTAHDYYMLCPRSLLLTKQLQICTSPQLACRLRSMWFKHCAQRIDMFCSPSRYLLDKHLEAGLHSPNTAVVPNGIPVTPRARRTGGTPGARPLQVLFAGRLTPEKGVRVALEAIRRVPADVPVELIVAGKGMLESEVRGAAALDPRIRFAGYVSGEAKEQLFASVDAMLLPSLWYENAPVVILEAAAYRLPVIASRLGAIPEFVTDGVNGSLFEPGNAQAAADLLVRLAQDRALLAQLSSGGSPLIEKHSVNRMVDSYLDCYARAAQTDRVPLVNGVLIS